ncbi:MAG: aspartate--tRNA ligase [Clostridia bacterium]
MDKIIKNIYRDHSCGELRHENVGEVVRVAGWISTVRDHGGITFIDLRDHYGIVQIVTKTNENIRLSKESVISVQGKVLARAENNINTKLPTGEIEIEASAIEMLGECSVTPPFDIMDSRNVNEEVRLKYRYLDLRNPELQKNLLLRASVIADLRKEMTALGFNEIQTPILTVSSPEGARDYIVPSRVNPGKFYALPQAPQQFKQLLMVSGMDKYFQIAPCFRDEDARADRCPGEFYQLDMEMSFATQEDVFAVMETVLPKIFEKYGKSKVDCVPFTRITYNDAMEKYGSDKPDLRNPLVITNLTEVFKNTTFSGFVSKTVKGICAKAGDLPRRGFDDLTSFAVENGAKGLAWVKVLENNEIQGPIVKFMTDSEKLNLIQTTGAKQGDAIFIVADTNAVCRKVLGLLRTELGKRLNIIEKGIYKFCWIVDFPMYELNEETGKIDFCHNPFTMPQGGLEALNTMDPLDIPAYQYDIIVNGIELSSGAVRNHDTAIMLKAFEIAGYDEKTIQTKFSALYNAFKFGAPPHAGIAPGVDRMVMLLLEEQSIREVVAFPMNKKAQDLMMGAPGDVTEKQLREVHIKLRGQNVTPNGENK